MRYLQVHRTKVTDPQVLQIRGADIPAGSPNKKCGRQIHTLSCKEACAHGNSMIYPWYLVWRFWSYGFGSWFLFLKYWTSVLGPLHWLSMVLVHGLIKGLSIKGKEIIWLSTHVLNILRRERSEIPVIGWWVITRSKSRRNLILIRWIYWWVEISLAHDQICKSDSLGYTWSLKNSITTGPQVQHAVGAEICRPVKEKVRRYASISRKRCGGWQVLHIAGAEVHRFWTP